MKICFYSSASSASSSLFNIIFINDADIQYSSAAFFISIRRTTSLAHLRMLHRICETLLSLRQSRHPRL